MTADPAPGAMPAWRRVVTSFLTLLAGEGVARAMGLATVVLLARALGPTGFGLTVFGASLVGWYALVVDNGTQVVTTSDIARRPEDFRRIVQDVMGLRLALGAVVCAAFVVAAQALARDATNADVYSLFALLAPAGALNLRWMVLGIHAARQLATANVASQLVLLVAVFLTVHDADDLIRVPLLYVASELVFGVVVLAQLASRFGLLRPAVDLGSWRSTLGDGSPLMVSAAARGVMGASDLLVITLLLGPKEAGFYGAALKPVQFAGTAVGLFSFSFLASFATQSGEQARRLLDRAVRSAVVISTAFAVLLAATSTVIVDVAFGEVFAPAAAALAVIAFRVPFVSLTGVWSSVLVAHARQAVQMRASMVGAVVNVAGMLIAVPLVGIVGAAAVSCLASGAILLVTWVGARQVSV